MRLEHIRVLCVACAQKVVNGLAFKRSECPCVARLSSSYDGRRRDRPTHHSAALSKWVCAQTCWCSGITGCSETICVEKIRRQVEVQRYFTAWSKKAPSQVVLGRLLAPSCSFEAAASAAAVSTSGAPRLRCEALVAAAADNDDDDDDDDGDEEEDDDDDDIGAGAPPTERRTSASRCVSRLART